MLEPPNGSSVVVWQKRVKHPNIFPELVRFIQLEVIFKKRREIKYKDTCFFFSFFSCGGFSEGAHLKGRGRNESDTLLESHTKLEPE